MTRYAIAASFAVLLACAGETGDSPRSDSSATSAVAAFTGAWRGTKIFLDANEQPLGYARGWTFEIESSPDGVGRIVNGPSITPTTSTQFTVDAFSYPLQPAGPGPGACGPIEKVIIGGAGSLATDGTLHLTIVWTETCDAMTTTRRAAYEMSRVPALAAYELSQL